MEPCTIASVAGDLISDGSLPDAMVTSLRRVALGIAVGALAGTALRYNAGLPPYDTKPRTYGKGN
ncbi:hypothetical protein [Streptomyces boninensis]|uniref:hypothetical protein n=1 Tax=Streptomyces boninensis TaxID=2039455 RepID=UPI003B21970D